MGFPAVLACGVAIRGTFLRVPVPRIETLETLPLVDHHCHGLVRRDLDRAAFERVMTEADEAGQPGASFFDSQLGFALRRYCAPVLDLPAHAPPDDYLTRRAELGADEVARRMLRAAGIADFCVDTGFAPERLTGSADLAEAVGGRGHDVVRLEPLAEQIALDIVTGQVGVAHFPDQVRARLAARAANTGQGAPVVGVKSVAAYRVGLELPAERPSDRVVIAAVRSWIGRLRAGASIRLADPVLHSFLIWTAADLTLPLQIHTGYGDTDLHLARANPLLLTDLLRALAPTGAPVLLLHCYPFHREAGYLAQVFPDVYLDVGLATHNVGRSAAAVLAEALELAPFGKLLFSTDAFALAELYLLGARLFRRALGAFLGTGVADGDWTAQDADRVAAMVGAGNARRVYGIAEPAVVATGPGSRAGAAGAGKPRVPRSTAKRATARSVAEPAKRERTAAKPAGSKPARSKPAGSKPTTPKAAPGKPATRRPATREPSTREPSTSEPGTREPSAREASAREAATKPGAVRRSAKPPPGSG